MKNQYFTSQRLIHTLLLLVLCLLIMTACGGLSDKDKTVGIRGFIVELTGDDASGNLSVEGIVEADTSLDKASVRITKDTSIQWKSTGKTAHMADLHTGSRVEIVFAGPVAESYPVQGTAELVRILPD